MVDCYIKPTNSWLAVKMCASENVESAFFGPKTKITTEGGRYLGDQSVHESLKNNTSQQKLMNE